MPAHNSLSESYGRGEGVPQDFVQSYCLLNLAASRSAGEFQKKCFGARDLVAPMLTPDELMGAQCMIREWEELLSQK